MKKIICLLSIAFIMLQSCSSEDSSNATNPQAAKIYFDAYNSNIGTNGIKWSEIYSVNVDGTNQQQITNYSQNGTIQIISEDVYLSNNSKIYFISNRDNAYGEVFKMNTDGSSLIRITDNSGHYFSNPMLYSNESKIIMDKESVDGVNGKYGEIYSMQEDGSNLVKLTNYPSEGSCYEAVINPNNSKIVYSCKINNIEPQLYTMAIDGSNKQILTTNNTFTKRNPKYSHTGTKIVFQARVASIVNKHSEIFIMNSDGSSIVQLTNYSNGGTLNTATNDPIFSNDDTQIYYVSNESGVSQIYKMNIDGSNKTILTTTPEDKSKPYIK